MKDTLFARQLRALATAQARGKITLEQMRRLYSRLVVKFFAKS